MSSATSRAQSQHPPQNEKDRSRVKRIERLTHERSRSATDESLPGDLLTAQEGRRGTEKNSGDGRRVTVRSARVGCLFDLPDLFEDLKGDVGEPALGGSGL